MLSALIPFNTFCVCIKTISCTSLTYYFKFKRNYVSLFSNYIFPLGYSDTAPLHPVSSPFPEQYFLFLFYFIFKFYIIVLVLPNIEMNPPQVYMCSPSWTLLPPPSPYHPSGSSQYTSPKHPISCIEPGLATHFIYDILHVSMPFSQIFPPFPSPRVHKTVLYIGVSFAVSYTGLLLPSF